MFALTHRPDAHPYTPTHPLPAPPFPRTGYYPAEGITDHGGIGPLSDTRLYDTKTGHHDPDSATQFHDGHSESYPNSRYQTGVIYQNAQAPPSSAALSLLYDGDETDAPRNSTRRISARSAATRLARDNVPPMIDTYNLGVEYSPGLNLVRKGPYSDHFGDSSSLSQPVKDNSLMPRSRKPRREKPRIDLAPDQPPTTQGKPRARVYVACLQCRTRKIRCDGAKPTCHNCARRASGSNDCDYDAVPKRRGPDKQPGARQRMARGLKDQLDRRNIPARRRRRGDTASSTMTRPVDQRENFSEVSRNRSRSDTESVLPLCLSLPLQVPAKNVSSLENLTQAASFVSSTGASYLECSSHDMVHRPDLLDVNQLEKPLGPVFNGSFDLSTTVPLATIPLPLDVGHGYITQLNEDSTEQPEDGVVDIASQPSLIFSRKIWWDSLLTLYSSSTSNRLQSLTVSQRESAAQDITSDIRFLFRASNYWFSFFHIPSFFGNFFDPIKRERIQPSLVLALLAMSTFWQSSEVGLGHEGRERALRFRDEAQSALDASFNAGWIDETLAQAAWLLALFEVCAHPRHSSERSTSSMVMLDSIIRSLSLTSVDVDDPNTSVFSPGAVPAVSKQHRDTWSSDLPPIDFSQHTSSRPKNSSFIPAPPSPRQPDPAGCSCTSMTLVEVWPEASEHAPLWASTPAWNSTWSEGEIRKESCRRLCWSSIILAAGHTSYATAHRSHALNLFISDPSNYALLFSGESVACSPALTSSYSAKDTIWALHDRSFLLWHGCIHMRSDSRVTDTDKAHFAVKAWLEADALESALNKHTCKIERAFIFQAREYIFNTRMCISHEFQRYIPLVTANVSGLFHRSKAEEWLTHQATVAERFMFGLHTITGHSTNMLARRPFFVFWFMGQISRALSLWECDNTLTVALDVCKALLPALDYLTALWPCQEQRYRYEGLRERLDHACYVARVGLPPPPNLTLPPLSSPSALV